MQNNQKIPLENQLEILKYASENGIIEMDKIWGCIEEMKKIEYLKLHPYKISQGKDGEWYTSFYENGKRKQKHRKTKEALEALIIKHIKEALECPTIFSIFVEWLELKLDRKEISKATYDRYLRDFHRYFKKIKDRRIETFTELDIEDFLKRQIKENNLTAKAFSNLRTLVYGMFRYAKKKNLISFSIKETVNDIDFAKNDFQVVHHEDITQVFFIEEEKRITAYLQEHIDLINLGLLLLFKTGLRIGELCTLEKSDIQNNKIQISRTETFYTNKETGETIYAIKESPKTKAGRRLVTIPDTYLWIIKRIEDLNKNSKYLFFQNGERIYAYHFRNRLTSLCKKLNIVHKSPHKIRKTYGSKLYDSPDISDALLASLMGHTDISCLQKHYYFNRYTEDEKSKILNKIGIL